MATTNPADKTSIGQPSFSRSTATTSPKLLGDLSPHPTLLENKNAETPYIINTPHTPAGPHEELAGDDPLVVCVAGALPDVPEKTAEERIKISPPRSAPLPMTPSGAAVVTKD